MNLVLYDRSEVQSDGTLVLRDFRFDHIKSVLKKDSEDLVKVGERNGKMGTAAIVSVSESEIVLKPELVNEPPTALPVTLIVAMSRPKSFRKLLHTATVMGVKEIYVIKTWRVDKSYWATPMLADDGLTNIIDDALMQTKDTIPPIIHIRKAFKPFVEDELPSLLSRRPGFCFHPTNSDVGMNYNKGLGATLIIGPEGGFIPYEVEMFEKQGAVVISLGDRIQRVEQAVASVLGYISMSNLH